jgi:hypothetical protein
VWPDPERTTHGPSVNFPKPEAERSVQLFVMPDIGRMLELKRMMKVLKCTQRSASVLLFVTGLVGASIPASDLSAQEKLPKAATTAASPEHALIQGMVGTWGVRASLWLGPDAKPIVQLAVARRRLVGEGLLEEIMAPSPGSDGPAFTRLAFLSYNAVTSSYEYMSWDTRAPQMMYQVSRAVGMPEERQGSPVIWFYLVDNFVVPQWGEARNVAFKQRLMLESGADRQVVRLYWTRL